MTPRYLPVPLAPTLKAILAPGIREGWWRGLTERSPFHAELSCSAGDALAVCLRALGPPGTVVVPAYTCPRVLAVLEALGERALPVDVDAESGIFDAERFEQAMRSVPKAVLLTHLFGAAADRDRVIARSSRDGVAVLEDCALFIDPASDARGEAARILSFGRGKPLAFGGGGALLVFDEKLASALPITWSVEPARRGVLDLWLGALRDGALALALAARLRPPSATPETKQSAFSPRIPSLRFRSALSHRILSGEHQKRRALVRSALAALCELWPGIAPNAVHSPGWRIPENALVPALALRVRDRDRAREGLRAMGIDCPRYWDECAFPADFLARHPGARHLAESLLFIPIAALLGRHARIRVAEVLSRHDPRAFA
jgi:hypothetical protein